MKKTLIILLLASFILPTILASQTTALVSVETGKDLDIVTTISPDVPSYEQRYRPLRAGIKITVTGNGCSIGFPAYYDKWITPIIMKRTYGFVTAEHCVDEDIDDASVYQPTISTSNLVGYLYKFPDSDLIDAVFVKTEVVYCVHGNCPQPQTISDIIHHPTVPKIIDYYPYNTVLYLNLAYTNSLIVFKAGYETGTTTGYILPFFVDGSIVFLQNISFNGIGDKTVFRCTCNDNYGDSGGIIYLIENEEGHATVLGTIVGIHSEDNYGPTYTYGTPYTDIREHVGVKGYG